MQKNKDYVILLNDLYLRSQSQEYTSFFGGVCHQGVRMPIGHRLFFHSYKTCRFLIESKRDEYVALGKYIKNKMNSLRFLVLADVTENKYIFNIKG